MRLRGGSRIPPLPWAPPAACEWRPRRRRPRRRRRRPPRAARARARARRAAKSALPPLLPRPRLRPLLRRRRPLGVAARRWSCWSTAACAGSVCGPRESRACCLACTRPAALASGPRRPPPPTARGMAVLRVTVPVSMVRPGATPPPHPAAFASDSAREWGGVRSRCGDGRGSPGQGRMGTGRCLGLGAGDGVWTKR